MDLMAIGENIYSTWLGGGYNIYQGTSFSAPIAAGAAALMASLRPSLTGAQLKAMLKQTVDPVAALATYCATGVSKAAVGNGEACTAACVN